jgi:outer membrane protein OmpA-like peptidoglycan-associated protein
LILAAPFWSASAQEAGLREQLFAEADQAMAAANEALANILGPASYERAAKNYRDAQSDLERGRSLDRIRADLVEAVRYFNQSIEAAQVARVSLPDALAAREDAMAADAATYATELWQEAEVSFATAARRLEDGNLNRARRAAEDAEEEYRSAELTAIENNYLSGARARIAEANRQRVKRYAPQTLERAERLLAEAEEALRRDRYDTDYPRTLAREANYEAQHSMYLAERIRAADDRDISYEALLLEAEAPLLRIAGELDVVAEFDEGFDAPTAEVVAAIDTLRDDQDKLQESNDRLAFLEDELARLEARLGEESEQRKLQEQIQQRFQQVASVFTRDEAQVLRRGNDVIVRMSLNFDSGSSVIKPEYFQLLRKIQTAIDVFPGAQVEVQGHTDAFGADEFNLNLSQERASAVQQYLLANMELGSSTISAMGYGETVPLANNETPEGRLRNRRIDLLIAPNLDALIAELARS